MFLARSGDALPLYITIVAKGISGYDLFRDEDNVYSTRAWDTLEFILARGGATSRWESLVVYSEASFFTLAVLCYMITSQLDNLRTLGFHTYKGLQGDELVAEVLVGQEASKSVLFETQPPLIRLVELSGMPPGFFFQHGATPIVSNLSSLNLTTVKFLPPLVGLRDLFIHSPRLETLSLHRGGIETTDFQDQPPATVRVRMLHLRQFTHHKWNSASWGLSVLKTVDAPALEMFSLDLDDIEDINTIIAYAAFGRRGDQLVDDHSRLHEYPDGAAIYPALKHLAIRSESNLLEPLNDMLNAFRNITRLDWQLDNDAYVCMILSKGTVCPYLEHLRVLDFSNAVTNLVHQRAKQGKPLKIVEVNFIYWDNVPGSTRRELEGELERFGPYVEEDESDDDQGDNDVDGSTDSGSDEDNHPPGLSAS